MKKRKFLIPFTIMTSVAMATGAIVLAACGDADSVAHNHEFSNTWSTDAIEHWHACSCGERGSVSTHDWGEGVVTAQATCTKDGAIEYTCSDCGRYRQEIIPAGHQKGELITGTAATCTTDGVLAHYHCTGCGLDFAEDGTVLGSLVIPGGHDWATTWSFDNSAHWHACAHCSETLASAEHEWQIVNRAAVDCTQPGVIFYACACGATTQVSVPAGHKMTHHEGTAATCTQNGSVEYWTCERCGIDFADANGDNELAGEKIIPAAHNFSTEWTVNEQTGEHQHDCLGEGCYERASDAALHTWKDELVHEDGVDKMECTVCGYKMVASSFESVGYPGNTMKFVAGGAASTKLNISGPMGHGLYMLTYSGDTPITLTRTLYDPDTGIYDTEETSIVLDPAGGTAGMAYYFLGKTINKVTVTADAAQAFTGEIKVGYMMKTENSYTLGEGVQEVLCTAQAGVRYKFTAEEAGDYRFTHTGNEYAVIMVQDGDCFMKMGATLERSLQAGETVTFYMATEDPSIDPKATGGDVARSLYSFSVHKHAYELTHDNGHESGAHWYECACGREQPDSREEHTSYWDNGVITTQPTCTADGVKTFTCTVCGETYTQAVEKLGHDFSADWTATEGEHGEHYHVCLHEGCDAHSETAEHTWNDEVIKPAECLTAGSLRHTCTVCAYSYTEEIPATGHSWEASYSHDKDGHWQSCSVCGADSEKTAHVWGDGEVTTGASCTEEGVKTFTCECGREKTVVLEKVPHSLQAVAASAPDCTHTGNVAYYECSVCHTLFSDDKAENQTTAEAVTIAMLGHDWAENWTFDGNNHWHVCTREGCDAVTDEAAHGYNAGVITTQPTCTHEGVKTFTCTTCERTYTAAVPATGHTLVATAAKSATCTEEGNLAYWTCSVCDELFSDEDGEHATTLQAVTVAALTHDLVHVAAVEATCTAQGNLEYWHCTREGGCGKYYLDKNATTAVAADAVKTPMAEHTIEEEWYFTEGKTGQHYHKCSVCGYQNNIATHGWNEGVVTTKATCTTDGVMTYTCTTCAATYTQTIEKTGHNFASEWTKSTDGTKHYHACLNAGCTVKSGEAAHSFTAEVKAPEYLKTGATAYDDATYYRSCATCGACDTDENNFFTDVGSHTHNHAWAESWTWNDAQHWHACLNGCSEANNLGDHEWELSATRQPTCTEKGEKTFTCSVCHATYTEDIEELGHEWATEWTADGTSHWHVCSRENCTAKNNESAHGWDDGKVTAQPTCTTDGVKTYTCTTCKTTKTESLSALNHTLDHVTSKAATCTEAGNKEYWHCTRCDKYFSDAAATQETTFAEATLGAKGHSLTVHIEAKAATCTATGNYEYWKCAACDKYFSDNAAEHETTVAAMTISALGHNWATAWSKNETHHYHICTRCDAVNEEDKAAHSWNSGTVTTNATCTTDGVKTFTCTVNGCGATKTEKVDKLGHKLTKTVAKEATCTADGTQEYWHCSRCNLYFSDEDCTHTTTVEARKITALGHNWSDWQTDNNQHWKSCTRCSAIQGGEKQDHEWGEWKVTTPSSCTQTGAKEHECSVCHKVVTDTVQIVEHTFGSEYYHDEQGYHWKKCENCSAITPLESHDGHWDSGSVTTQPTCTADGVKTFTCTLCGATKTEKVNKQGHQLTATAAKNATCTEKGNRAYWYCSRCEKYFSDAECKNEAEMKDLIIAALGHSTTYHEAHAASCTADGNIEYWSCSRCNKHFSDVQYKNEVTLAGTVVAHTGHDLVHHEAHTPTCTAEGNIEYWQCNNCNKVYANASATTQITGSTFLDRTAHVFDNHYDDTCNACGETRTVLHHWDWDYNGDDHWKACTLGEGCEETKEREAHVFDDDNDIVCDICGYWRTIAHSYQWHFNEKYHWETCSMHQENRNTGRHTFVNGVCSACGMQDLNVQTFAVNQEITVSGSAGTVKYYRLTQGYTSLIEVKLTFSGCTVVYRRAAEDYTYGTSSEGGNSDFRGGYTFKEEEITSGVDFALSGFDSADLFIVTLTGSSASFSMTAGSVPGMSIDKPKTMELGVTYNMPSTTNANGFKLNYYKFTPTTSGTYTFYTEVLRNSFTASNGKIEIYSNANYESNMVKETNAVFVDVSLTAGTTYYIAAYENTASGCSIITVQKTSDLDKTGTTAENLMHVTLSNGANVFRTAPLAQLTPMNYCSDNTYQYGTFFTFTAPSGGVLTVSGSHVYKYTALDKPYNGASQFENSQQEALHRMTFSAGETVKLVVFTDTKPCDIILTWSPFTQKTYRFRLTDQFGNPIANQQISTYPETTTAVTDAEGRFTLTCTPTATMVVSAGTYNLVESTFFAADGSNADGRERTFVAVADVTVRFVVYLDGEPYTGNGTIYTNSLGQTEDWFVTASRGSAIGSFTNGVLNYTFKPTDPDGYAFSAYIGDSYLSLVSFYYNDIHNDPSKDFRPGDQRFVENGDICLYISTAKLEGLTTGSTIPYNVASYVSLGTFRGTNAVHYTYTFSGTPGATYKVIGVPATEHFQVRSGGDDEELRYKDLTFSMPSTMTNLYFDSSFDIGGSAIVCVKIVRVDGGEDKVQLQPWMVDDIENQTYTGTAIEPISELKVGGKTLVKNVDYNIRYDDNVNAGTATVTITGKGNYSGTITKTFLIVEYYNGYPVLREGEHSIDYGPTTVAFRGAPYGIYKLAGNKYSGSWNMGTLTSRDLSVEANGEAVAYDEATHSWSFTCNVEGICILTFTHPQNYINQNGRITFTLTGTYIPTTPITENDITVATGSVYTGSAVKPAVTVVVGGTTLIENEDYTLSYSNNTNAGLASVVVEGMGGYAGRITKTFTIAAKDISSATVAPIAAVTYNGNTHEPSVTVTLGGKTLAVGEDYTVSYSNHTNQGTATVTIQGKGNYTGSTSATFTINKASLSSATVAPIAAVTYNGTAQKPALTITVNGRTLTADDYTATYSNNTNQGTATVSIQGKGNYTGSTSATFTINKATLTAANISDIAAQTYTGGELKPTVTVTFGGSTLTSDDYTVSYSNNTNKGTATVTVTGKGNFDGAPTKNFTIGAASMSGVTIGAISAVTYNGSAHEPTVTVTFGGNAVASSDYTVSYSNNTNAGQATVKLTATANGNFTGEKSTGFTIQAATLTSAMIGNISAVDFTGSAQEPAVTVTFNGRTLTADDCMVGYTNNTNAGTATVTVTGKGNFTGTPTKTFTINKVALANNMIQAIPDQAFTGGEVKPAITVKYGSYTLTDNDYTVGYSNNTSHGTATVTITAKASGNFTGTASKNFEIMESKDLTLATIEAIANQTYTGSAIEPAVTVKIDGSVVSNANYTVSYSGAHTAVGEYTVTVTGSGVYTGSKSTSFRIVAAAMSGVVFSEIPAQRYDGAQLQPSFSVTFNGKPVDASVYTVTYGANNTAGATAGSVTITAKANTNFTGSATKTFEIYNRIAITSEMISIASQVYTGSALTPVVVVTNGVTLTAGTHYTVSAGTYTGAGTYEISVTGIGDYKGTAKQNFVVEKATLTSAMIGNIAAQTYTGSAQEPAVTVTFNGRTLTSDDYTVSYANNTNKGTATVTVTGKGNFTGAPTKTFEIGKASLANATITAIAAQTYTGSELKPAVEVKFNGSVVNANEYTVGYTNNTNKGTANVTVTAKADSNFADSKSTTFTINAATLTSAMIGNISAVDFTGNAHEPAVTVTFNGATLTAGTDYTVGYTNNTNAGTATVTVTGSGNFTGTPTKTFTINKIALSGVSFTIASRTYTGDAIEPALADITAKLNNNAIAASNFTITGYDNNVEVGNNTASVTLAATANGNFTGTATVYFSIKPSAAINDATITIASQVYTGSALTPVVSVSYNNVGLKQGRDYTVSTGTFINAGTYEITITGAGNYAGGDKTATFTITKANMSDVAISGYETSYEETGSAIKPTVTVKFNNNTVTANNYTVSYGTNTAPGIGTITVTATANGNFTGSKTVEFTIAEKNVPTLKVGGNANVEVGKTYKFAGVAGETYNFHFGYSSSINNLNTYATVSCSGSGASFAERKITFTATTTVDIVMGEKSSNAFGGSCYVTIAKCVDISNATVRGVNASYAHNGSEIRPEVTVEVDGVELYDDIFNSNESDYTVSYSNNINLGTASITITGKEDYSGTKVVYFAIKPSMSHATVTLSERYDSPAAGDSVEPTDYVVTYNGNQLTLGNDFTVTYGDNNEDGIGAGSITFIATDSCVLAGEYTVYFSIGNVEDLFSEELRGTYKGSAPVMYTGATFSFVIVIDANTISYNAKTSTPGFSTVNVNPAFQSVDTDSNGKPVYTFMDTNTGRTLVMTQVGEEEFEVEDHFLFDWTTAYYTILSGKPRPIEIGKNYNINFTGDVEYVFTGVAGKSYTVVVKDSDEYEEYDSYYVALYVNDTATSSRTFKLSDATAMLKFVSEYYASGIVEITVNCAHSSVGNYVYDVDTHYQVCNECGQHVNVAAHTWNETSTTATCTEAGVTSYECPDCHATKNANVGALGHDWEEDESRYDSATGKKMYVCKRCSAEEAREGTPSGGGMFAGHEGVYEGGGENYSAVVTLTVSLNGINYSDDWDYEFDFAEGDLNLFEEGYRNEFKDELFIVLPNSDFTGWYVARADKYWSEYYIEHFVFIFNFNDDGTISFYSSMTSSTITLTEQ